MDRHPMRRALAAALLVVLTVAASGCLPAVPSSVAPVVPPSLPRLFPVTVQVTDETGAPIAGALVTTSDGQSLTTGPDGKATIRWSRLGNYHLSVVAPGRMPVTLTVAIPQDTGQLLKATLPAPTPPPETGTTPSTPPSVPPPTYAGPGAFPGPGVPLMATGPERIGPAQSLGPSWAYPFIFQAMFSAYGYGLDLAPYRPGQWTSWEARSGSGQASRMRKAFLGYADGGREWWQVRLGDDAVVEVLFGEGRQSIRRLRQRFGNEPPREMPVMEGWYTPPVRLTPESLEGAVVEPGVEVQVPAGTFRADRLEFGVGPGLVLRMWRATDVPGGIVRYELSGPSGEGLVAELTGYGDGAVTELGSY